MKTRVLVCDPHPEVRGLLLRVAERLGYDAVAVHSSELERAPAADVLVLDPTDDEVLAFGRALRERDPSLAVVVVCSLPPVAAVSALEPVAVLLKPFPLAELERALTVAAVAEAVGA